MKCPKCGADIFYDNPKECPVCNSPIKKPLSKSPFFVFLVLILFASLAMNMMQNAKETATTQDGTTPPPDNAIVATGNKATNAAWSMYVLKAEMEGTYTGEVANGRPNGQGTWETPWKETSTIRMTGNFVDGQITEGELYMQGPVLQVVEVKDCQEQTIKATFVKGSPQNGYQEIYKDGKIAEKGTFADDRLVEGEKYENGILVHDGIFNAGRFFKTKDSYGVGEEVTNGNLTLLVTKGNRAKVAETLPANEKGTYYGVALSITNEKDFKQPYDLDILKQVSLVDPFDGTVYQPVAQTEINANEPQTIKAGKKVTEKVIFDIPDKESYYLLVFDNQGEKTQFTVLSYDK